MTTMIWKVKKAGIRMKVRIRELIADEQGIGVVEVILILVGIFTPYYRVGIRCMA